MLQRKKLSRRQFLRVSATGAVLVGSAACTASVPTAVPAPAATSAPPAEPTSTAAATQAATQAPAAAETGFNVAEFAKGFDPAPASAYAYDDMSKKHAIKWMRGSWYKVGTFPEVDPIKKYIDQAVNVDFDLIVSPNPVFQEINLRVASGEGAPDVWWEVNLEEAKKLADDGVAIPDLMPYIEQYCPNYLKLLDVAGGKERNLRAATVDGKVVAFARPTFTGEPGDHIFVRQDWLDNLGLEAPKTTDDLFNLAKTLQEKGSSLGCKYGITPGALFKDQQPLGGFSALSNAFGCPQLAFLEQGNLSWGPALPARKDFLAYLKQFVDAKLLPEDWYLWIYPEGFDKLNPSDWGVFVGGAWGVFSGGAAKWKGFPNLEFIKWVDGPAGHRWGARGETTAIVSEQLSTALLKDEDKLKRIMHIMDLWASPYSNLSKAASHRPYQMDPPFENGDCIVREFKESGDFVEVIGWGQTELGAVDDATKQRCPWLADEKQRQSLGEWRPMAISVWTKQGYSWAGQGKLEDSILGEKYHMKDYWFKWWAELADQEYYDTVTLRGDPALQADANKFMYANELKFVLGQRPLSEWDAYVGELMDKYKAKELLQATLKAMQDAGDSVPGFDPRLPM